MILIDKIVDILNSMDDIETVLYDSPYSANLKIDRLPEPYAIVYPMQSAVLDLRNNLREGLDLEIFFCKSVQLDADGAKHLAVIDDCMSLAKSFLALLKQEKSIISDENITIRAAYGRYDKNVSGVSVELSLSDRQTKCLDSTDPQIRTLTIEENGEYDVTHYGKVVVNVE